MILNINCFIKILALMAVITPVVVQNAFAATFEVTSSSFNDPNGFRAALMQANANPGPDVINININQKIIYWAPPELTHGADSDYGVSVTVTDALTINGNGTKILGANDWVDYSGQVSRFIENDNCPKDISGSLLIGISGGFLQVGQRNSDNSAVKVTVNDLTIEKLSGIAKIRQNASLTLHNVQANKIRSLFNCNASLVLADHGANFTMEGGGFALSQIFYDPPPRYLIYGGTPTNTGAAMLTLKNVNFDFNHTGYVAGWNGPAEITSSRFINSGGFELSGGAVKITNSLFYHPDIQWYWDSLRIWHGTVDIVASTFVLGQFNCKNTDLLCNWVGPGFQASLAPFQAGPGGVMNFSQSIAAVQWIQDWAGAQTKLMEAFDGGQITADAQTFIQPVSLQSAADLKILTGQPNLITDPPGLYVYSNYADFSTLYEQVSDFMPQLGTAASPSKLINAIPDAQSGGVNQLLAPDGSFITTDVLGNPRVDSNNRRNIGALQSTQVLTVKPADAHIEANWTQMIQPPNVTITNYQLCYHTSVLSLISVNCPGTLQNTSDATTLHTNINGLINGTHYWVMVRANTDHGVGPWSNVADGIPAGVPDAPAPSATYGDGLINLTWIAPADNGSAITNYVVKYRPQGSSAWIPWAFSGTTLNITINSLSNGTTYEFEVAAVNGVGQGAFGTTTGTPAKALSLAYPTPINVYKGFPQTINPAIANLLGNPTFSGALPTGMALDSTMGVISVGAGTVPGQYSVTIQLSQSGSVAQTTSATFSITVIDVPQKLQLIYPDLLNVPVGSGPYTLAPSTTGFTGPIIYSITDGSLPPGLTLDSNTGIISGTPTTATSGVFTPTIRASAQNGNEIWQNVLEIEILPLLSYPVANPTLGTPFTLTPTVSPSVLPGTFSVVEGVLPDGLVLNITTGVISGTPTSLVSSRAKIQYLTGTGHQQTVSANIGFSPSSYPINLIYPSTTSRIGQPLSLMPTMSGAKGTSIYSLSSDNLPAGLVLNSSSGAISGVPSGPVGTFAIRVSMSDSYTSVTTIAAISIQSSLPTMQSTTAIPTLSEYGIILLIGLMILVVIWPQSKIRR